MGFGRRLVRKTVRKATPRSVRRAMHPVRTVRYAVTPRPVKQVSRAMYTVTNPLGAAENALIGAALNAGSGRGRRRGAAHARRRTAHAPSGQGARVERATAAEASTRQIAQLMSVQRVKFAAVQRPIVAQPARMDPVVLAAQLWAQRRSEVPFWYPAKRRALRAEVDQIAAAQTAYAWQQAQENARLRQAEVDHWWANLLAGHEETVTACLVAAFADNPAPVLVQKAAGTHAELMLFLPGIDVLPDRQAVVTPAGRWTTKAWTKTELNRVYASLLGAHLLATLREAWAVAPSLRQVRVVGVRTVSATSRELLFDVEADRADGNWDDDRWGDRLLQDPVHGLRRSGRAQEVTPWPRPQV